MKVNAPKTTSPCDGVTLRVLRCAALLLLSCSILQGEPATPTPPVPAPKYRVLVLTETGGQHGPFVEAAKLWLKKCSEENGFVLDYIHRTDGINEASLASHRLFIQLDFPPYGWTPAAMAAFKSYIEQGKGGWVGFHHA